MTESSLAHAARFTRGRLQVFMLAALAAACITTLLGLLGHELHVPVAIPILEVVVGVLVFGRVYGLLVRSNKYLSRLDEAEARYRTLVEQIPAVVYMNDAGEKSTNVYVGPQIESLLGYTPEEWLSTPGIWLSLVHPEDKERVLVELARSNAEEDVFRAEFRMFARDGREVWVRDDARLVRCSDGRAKYWHGILFDVTAEREAAVEKEALEAHLRQAQKMEAVGQLAGGIAHDFNNLLAVIQTYARFVYDEMPEVDKRRADLEEVMRASERGAGLIRRLLTFSRKEIVEPEVVDLNGSIGEMLPLIRRVLSEEIEIRTRVEAGLSPIVADRSQIDQVLMNLAMNSGDAMEGRESLGGVLEIATFNRRVDADEATEELPAGDYACLTVTDNGCGMEPDVTSRAFEPFFTTKGRGAGTGLGLASVYGIVQRTRGAIDVESEVGVGTTFRILFPAAAPGPEEAGEVRRAPGSTIMVVEDEVPIRKLVGRLLERGGHTVLLCETPHHALEIAGEHDGPIDLLLTDVVMPAMSGKQLSGLLSTRRPGIPTLYMSGYPEDILVRHDVSSDSDDYIQKPFWGDALLEKIKQILDRTSREAAVEVGR